MTKCQVFFISTVRQHDKLGLSAQEKWRKLRGFKLLAEVIRGVRFRDGDPITQLTESELHRAVG